MTTSTMKMRIATTTAEILAAIKVAAVVDGKSVACGAAVVDGCGVDDRNVVGGRSTKHTPVTLVLLLIPWQFSASIYIKML